MVKLHSVQFTIEELKLLSSQMQRHRPILITRDYYLEDLQDSVIRKLQDAIDASTRISNSAPEMIS